MLTITYMMNTDRYNDTWVIQMCGINSTEIMFSH